MPYLLIFLTVCAEGPIATFTAAALAENGTTLALFPVFLTAMIANLCADICWFLLGAAGKHGRILHRIPWLKHQENLTERASLELHRSGIKVFILTKFTFGIGTIPLLIAAGMLNVNRTKLLAAAICTETVWTGGLVLLGSTLGRQLPRIQAVIAQFIEYYILYPAGLALLLVIAYHAKRLFQQPEKTGQ